MKLVNLREQFWECSFERAIYMKNRLYFKHNAFPRINIRLQALCQVGYKNTTSV